MTEKYKTAPTKVWDSYDAYLFDIDGTLLTSSDAVHYFAFCNTLEMISGQPMDLDGVVVHGNTDIGILRDALNLKGINPASWRPLRREAIDRMGMFVAEHKQDLKIRVLSGVHDLLAHLAKRGALLGVATGNLQAIGRLKLEAAGISHFFTCGSYSDEDEYRHDIFGRAVESVQKQIGTNPRICILGDTPEDVRAARHHSVDIIAVASGIYTLEELTAETPTECCSSLADLLT